MSQAHLKQLHAALIQRGWKVEARERGEAGVEGAATWVIHRPGEPPLWIDFAGFGGMGEDIPVEASYACQVRGQPIDLYFSRIQRSRARWRADLARFLDALACSGSK